MTPDLRIRTTPLYTTLAIGLAALLASAPAMALWAGEGSSSGMFLVVDRTLEDENAALPLNVTLEELDAECAPIRRGVRDPGDLTEYGEEESPCVHAFLDRMNAGDHNAIRVGGDLYVVSIAMTMTGLPDDGEGPAPAHEEHAMTDKQKPAEAPGLVGGILFGLAMLALVAVRKL